MAFSKTFEVKWADLDPNFHLRGSTYLDFTDQTRFSFFQQNGIPVTEWRKMGIGPVILEERIRFLKEVFLEEQVRVTFKRVGVSPNQKIFQVKHEILKENGQPAAEVDVTVGLLDLKTRKLAPAPDSFLELIEKLEKVEENTPTAS